MELLLQVDLIHQVSNAMNLYLLYLVSALCNFLVLIYVLDLELSLDVELEGLHQVLISVLGWLLVVLAMALQLLGEPGFMLHQLALDLILDVIEIQRRDIRIRVLSNLNLNFFLRTQLDDQLDYGLSCWLGQHVLNIALHTLNIYACLGSLNLTEGLWLNLWLGYRVNLRNLLLLLLFCWWFDLFILIFGLAKTFGPFPI